MDHPFPWLRYLDAGNLDTDTADFEGLEVESPSGEHLGKVDGFVVDKDTGRPYSVVVDSGGWFKSKRFLMPVGHARLESDAKGDSLQVDISRERIDRFPGFNKNEFEKFSAADLKRFNDETCAICAVTEVTFSSVEPFAAAWDRPDFQPPDWWRGESAPPKQETQPQSHRG